MKSTGLERILHEHGYKLTNQRLSVLKVIASTHDHLTPGAIYDRVREEYPSIGLVTVYRVLDILLQLQLICKVHARGDCRSYLLRRSGRHHHHLVCSNCGTVVDFTNCDISYLEKRLSDETGFQIQDHLLEFQGICQDCLTGKNIKRRVRGKTNKRYNH